MGNGSEVTLLQWQEVTLVRGVMVRLVRWVMAVKLVIEVV